MDSGDLENPANAALCRYFKGRGRADAPALARPDAVPRPYDSLGTHPDLVARLWDEITARLPADCRFVVFGAPALVHPETKIVFGFAGGTHTYALRLPEDVRKEALLAGAGRVKKYPRQPSFDLEVIGPEWVFCGWFKGEERWCLSAYEFASGVT
ncbi:MAG TPA: hypothetical protein VFT43_08225 [Candidatus Polarisedimenticolia bacterium]|nr:hypothetical protein [Candidatus Polarisedimenticolia bacterium]